MKVFILQTDIAWADPQANILQAEKLLEENAPEKGALIVLPEMWATGFAVNPIGIAEDEGTSIALAWMKRTARERGCAVSGSLAMSVEDGSYRNRHYFVTPTSTHYYDKRHLFAHGHEDDFIIPGREAVIVEWQGWCLLLLTCYDLRFPVFSRYGRAGEYDAIILVANWPDKRQHSWNILTQARAIENQCYVLAANRCGNDPKSHYIGGSAIINPLGQKLCEAADAATSISTDLELNELQAKRQRFRVLADRDTDLYLRV